MKGVARREGLLVRELGEETVIYDRESQQAHCLNGTAAFVFRHCDGTRSAEEIAGLLSEGTDAAARQALVGIALERLTAARLLVPDADDVCRQEPDAGATSRRELLRVAALAVPAIASVVAPTPAQAASACLDGIDCGSNPVSNCGLPCAPLDNGDCSAGWHCNVGGECLSSEPGC